MFERSRLLLEEYYCRLLATQPDCRAEHLLQEIRGRLRGLQWLLRRLRELDQRLDTDARRAIPLGQPQPDIIKQVFADATRPDCAGYNHATFEFAPEDEVRVLLEAFYYSAHRIRDILQAGRSLLTGIGRFEAEGVRNVRNHLVEHPDGTNGVLVFSTATGGPVGPQMKPVR